jgi:hypothetical protein
VVVFEVARARRGAFADEFGRVPPEEVPEEGEAGADYDEVCFDVAIF